MPQGLAWQETPVLILCLRIDYTHLCVVLQLPRVLQNCAPQLRHTGGETGNRCPHKHLRVGLLIAATGSFPTGAIGGHLGWGFVAEGAKAGAREGAVVLSTIGASIGVKMALGRGCNK